MRRQNDSSGKAGALLLAAGVGAALMYFLDPGRGARRRAIARDRTASAVRSGSESVQRRAEDARNRITGAVASARNRLRRDAPTERQLVERVRSELGRHTDHVSAIEVLAEDGVVTLRGQVLAEELSSVVATARRVRGVEDVHDELEVRDAIPAGGLTRKGPEADEGLAPQA
ncbi:MAG TPA: BON domain-containing protein [Gemmatimonadales bacterium]|nr:BON domain-containing protein [Gemmatimonadales bacterium]